MFNEQKMSLFVNFQLTKKNEEVTMEIHFNLKPIPEFGTIERGSGSHKLENLSKFNLF